mgnify:CR=1 FL=1
MSREFLRSREFSTFEEANEVRQATSGAAVNPFGSENLNTYKHSAEHEQLIDDNV